MGDDSGADGRFPQGTTCGAALDVRGGLELRIAPSDTSTACVTAVSFGSGFMASFLFVDSNLSHVEVEVEDVIEGETGENFPAQLGIVHDDGREWIGANCVADIAEHEYVAPAELGWKSYRVSGSIECTTAATVAESALEDLDLRSFAFVATIHWG